MKPAQFQQQNSCNSLWMNYESFELIKRFTDTISNDELIKKKSQISEHTLHKE